jgi:hypothetical protein
MTTKAQQAASSTKSTNRENDQRAWARIREAVAPEITAALGTGLSPRTRRLVEMLDEITRVATEVTT